MKSARGIFYNLDESNYIFHIEKEDDYILYFSSEFTMKRYADKIENYIKELNDKFKSTYLIDININKLAIIYLYNKMEKRGFKLLINEVEYKNINDINLIVK